MSEIRIDKYLSVALNISRTDAKQLLKKSNITVAGERVIKSDFKLDEGVEVKKDGITLVYKKYIYIMMNKPAGLLSASSDKRVKTVVDILPEHLKREGLFPVGRLDKDTTGLLIITDDGDFGHRVMSPKSHTEKCYLAELDGRLKEEHIEIFSQGVTLASGEECLSAKLEILGESLAEVTVCEGKYHQIKRMFGTIGLGVNKLHRTRIGGLILPENMPIGEARELTADEKSLI